MEVLLVVQVDLAELVVAELVEMIRGLQEQLDLQLLEKMQLQTLITMLRQLSTKGEPVVLHDTNVKAKQVFITQNIHNNQHTTIKRHDKMRIDKGLFVLHFD